MYSRILVPIDGSPTAQRGLQEAITLAQQLGSSLRILNVVDARLLIGEVSAAHSPEQLLDDWRAAAEKVASQAVKLAREAGVAADAAVRCDPRWRVFELILQEGRDWGAELIIMGTHGRRGLRRLALGSDAEMVLRDSAIPVLLVRGPEVDTPPGVRPIA
jgi:nucleotide-binding universal stress UspA family protein